MSTSQTSETKSSTENRTSADSTTIAVVKSVPSPSGRQLEIASSDVVRLIEQYLKESGLHRTLKTLHEESGVALNTVDSVETFVSDIVNGKWDRVLEATSLLSLPASKLADLYEHIALELLESREVDAVRALIKSTPVFVAMRKEDPERIVRLERLATFGSVDSSSLFAGLSREARRQAIALALRREVTEAPPSRLLSLLGMALKWQLYTGRLELAQSQGLDLFLGSAPMVAADDEKAPSTLFKVIKLGSGARPECAIFSPDGAYLITGSSDGFVEAYDVETGQLSTSLSYQAAEEFLMHEDAVTSMAFTRDGALLASATSKGEIKIWRFHSGDCTHKLQAHSGLVTSLDFLPDGTQILSSSVDGVARVHGLRSSRMLKEFRGHSGSVTGAIISDDTLSVTTGGSDGVLKTWSMKTGDNIATISLTQSSTQPPAVTSLARLPNRGDALIVSSRSDTVKIVIPRTASVIQLFTPPANLLASTSTSSTSSTSSSAPSTSTTTTNAASSTSSTSSTSTDASLQFSTASARGRLVYATGPEGVVFCFSVESGKLLHAFKAHAQPISGIIHHPFKNICATYSIDGTVKLWK